MDVFTWIRKHKGCSVVIAVILTIIIPWAIDKAFNTTSPFPVLSVHYESKDILSYYGIVLGSVTTIIALIETLQHTEKMYKLDYELKLTPVLNSNYYNHSKTSRSPLRVLYVNTHPLTYFFDRVMVHESIDWRDLQDTFFSCQIDYLVQNISETSAVGIKLFLNDDLLYGPFSLVAGGEESIGICFFDKSGLMIDEYYDQKYEFDIKVEYTNSNRSKKYIQTETIKIEYRPLRNDNGPIIEPAYSARTGLSDQVIQN